MRTIKCGVLPTRAKRAWAVVVATGCLLALLGQPVTASAATPTTAKESVSGKVGTYQFSTATRSDAAGSCGFAKGRLTRIAVAPPRAKMRAYWAEPHHGRLAVGQYVEFVARLSGLRQGTWTTLARAHEYVLVPNALTRFPALPAFIPPRETKRGYQGYRVIESLEWLRPTDNVPEGSVVTTLTHYRVAKRWDGYCPVPPTSVAGIKAARGASAIKVTWTNRSPALIKSIVVRYARGSKPPAGPTDGHAVPLAHETATQFVLGHLRPRTRYAFSIWAYGKSHLWSSRRTTVVTTRAPRVPPLATPTIAVRTSGPWVGWTVSTDPSGQPVTVRVTTDHGFDQTYTTGTTPWTSSASEYVGYSATDHVQVTVSAAGRTSASASSSATTGSRPLSMVSISRGATCAGHCGFCVLPTCAFIHVATANFAGSVTCTFSSQLGSTGLVSETYAANDSKDSVNYWGIPGTWVQATCGGITARMTW